jgi:RNA polymerase sigma-54 factor
MRAEADENPSPDREERKAEEIDWDRYLENHTLQQPPPAVRSNSEELPSIEATLTRRPDLAEHLLWQLKLGEFAEEERRFGMLVIGNTDEDGYLKDASVEELAREAGLDPEDAEEVLKVMQEFDPLGVCSRSLAECLLVQTRHFGLGEMVERIISEQLSNLEKKNFPAIARALNIPLEEVYEAAKEIAELDPRPGRNHTADEPNYIVPDVHVHKIGDKYFVVANDDGLPKLKISSFYRQALAGDSKAREYVQGKLRSAQWLIRSIDQRRRTIVRVTECIVEKQREFFDKGVAYLKPMILRDVADAVGMHESTISRVTTNKYVHTPQGLFELKYFFNSAIRRTTEDDLASEAVKQAIKKIIGEEDAENPLSDQRIVEILAERGIVIARRTVAKYREMLGILASSKRKKYF